VKFVSLIAIPSKKIILITTPNKLRVVVVLEKN